VVVYKFEGGMWLRSWRCWKQVASVCTMRQIVPVYLILVRTDS
jgi:enterochelin esterase-like enzyme